MYNFQSWKTFLCVAMFLDITYCVPDSTPIQKHSKYIFFLIHIWLTKIFLHICFMWPDLWHLPTFKFWFNHIVCRDDICVYHRLYEYKFVQIRSSDSTISWWRLLAALFVLNNLKPLSCFFYANSSTYIQSLFEWCTITPLSKVWCTFN